MPQNHQKDESEKEQGQYEHVYKASKMMAAISQEKEVAAISVMKHHRINRHPVGSWIKKLKEGGYYVDINFINTDSALVIRIFTIIVIVHTDFYARVKDRQSERYSGFFGYSMANRYPSFTV